MSQLPNSKETLEQRLLALTLGCATAPILAGLVLAQLTENWLRSLKLEDQRWWVDQRLPPLDHQTLVTRSSDRTLDRSGSGADTIHLDPSDLDLTN